MTTRLKRLKIERYKNVAPCDLHFGDRFNVLLGPNGSGKTTLLELIADLLRSKLVDDFEDSKLEIELASGDVDIRVAISPDSSAAPSLPLVLSGKPPPALRIGVGSPERPRFTGERNGGVTRISDEAGAEVVSSPQPFPIIPSLLTLLGQSGRVASSSRFDESLELFGRMWAGKGPLSFTLALAKHETLGWRAWECPAALRKSIEQGFQDLADPPNTWARAHTDLPFLRRFVELANFKGVELQWRLAHSFKEKPGGQSDLASAFYESIGALFRRPDGSTHDEQALSYGQKRLFTFLCYVDSNPDIVLADELVNGLHHAWIKACMKELEERQAFLTSQNPLLLDYLEFKSIEEVRSTFVLCDTTEIDGRDLFVWRNMNDDEATMFFDAYQAGIQHVGEILRTKGLW